MMKYVAVFLLLVSGCVVTSGRTAPPPSGAPSTPSAAPTSTPSGGPSRWITLPVVLALTEAEARAAIADAGFHGTLTIEGNASCQGAPLGHACWTDPQSRAMSGGGVRLGIQSKPATILADCTQWAGVALAAVGRARCEAVNAQIKVAREKARSPS